MAGCGLPAGGGSPNFRPAQFGTRIADHSELVDVQGSTQWSGNGPYETLRPLACLIPPILTKATKYSEKLSGPHPFKRHEIESANHERRRIK